MYFFLNTTDICSQKTVLVLSSDLGKHEVFQSLIVDFSFREFSKITCCEKGEPKENSLVALKSLIQSTRLQDIYQELTTVVINVAIMVLNESKKQYS